MRRKVFWILITLVLSAVNSFRCRIIRSLVCIAGPSGVSMPPLEWLPGECTTRLESSERATPPFLALSLPFDQRLMPLLVVVLLPTWIRMAAMPQSSSSCFELEPHEAFR